MTDRLSASIIALMTDAVGPDGKGWVHLVPNGSFRGVDGRGPYFVNNPGKIIQASRELAGQRQMVIDYDHSTDLARGRGGPVPAAGWIVGLQARANGIWGLVEWTKQAADFIAKREYRYLSPAFLHDEKTGEVGAILRAALTNVPNLDQLPALASANEAALMAAQENKQMDLKKLAAALGLPDTATFEDVLAAINALRNGGAVAMQGEAPDPAKWVPIGDFQRAIAEVHKLSSGVSLQAAEERVRDDIRKGLILPWMKNWAISLCTMNLPSYQSFVGGVGPGFSHLTRSIEMRAGSGSLTLDDNEKAVARTLGLTDEQFGASRGN
jgi:phage I-like protein